jgi:hypothetical protein
MSRPWQRAAPLLAASVIGCAGSPSAHISEQRLDGPRPPQAIIRCETDGLTPPLKIAWKLPPEVKQIGWGVPSDNETALLVQVPGSSATGMWAECTATGKDGVVVKVERSLNPPVITAAPAKIKRGDKVTVRGSGFGRTRGADDAIYLVPAWGAALALDHKCKGAAWSDSAITACLPPSLPSPSPSLLLRVQASGELAQAAAPLVVTP